MVDGVIKIVATCSVVSKDHGNEHGIYNNSRPNFYFDGKYSICLIMVDDSDVLEPGQIGNIHVNLLASDSENFKLPKLGDNFELRAGPDVIARCVVDSISSNISNES